MQPLIVAIKTKFLGECRMILAQDFFLMININKCEFSVPWGVITILASVWVPISMYARLQVR